MTNIAKRMTVAGILKNIGLDTIQRHDGYWLYPSPVSVEEFLCLDVVNDTWLDTHSEEQGDYLSLIRGYLKAEGKNSSEDDVVRWIDIMTGKITRIEPVPVLEIIEPASRIVVKSKWPLNGRD